MPQPLNLPKLRTDYPRTFVLTRAYNVEWGKSANQTVGAATVQLNEAAAVAYFQALHPELALDQTGYHKALNGDTYTVCQLHQAAGSAYQYH